MQFTNNKFITTLVITNIIALIAIFILIWILWNNNETTLHQVSSSVETLLPGSNDAADDTLNVGKKSALVEKTVTLIDAIIKEIKNKNGDAKNLEPQTLDPNNLKPSETNSERKSTPQDKLSDREYISAFKKMIVKQPPESQFSKSDISSIQATGNRSKNDETGNHFNKVDVSQLNSSEKPNSLAQKITSIVTEKENNNDKNPENAPAWKVYLKTLKDEGVERKNEMRTVTIKQGETLWRIAKRAYGSGFKYKKIFKANPHLTNPHNITAGEILRVPL